MGNTQTDFTPKFQNPAFLQSSFTNELDGSEISCILDEIEYEIDDITEIETDEKENEIEMIIDFVPVDNIISDLWDLFKFEKQLGKGGSCTVMLVSSLDGNKNQYALKELPKNNINHVLFIQEVNIMKKLQVNSVHKNVVKFVDCYIDDNYYYILLEYESGGTMLDRILCSNFFSERTAAKWIQTILDGVQYLHSLNIVHRDLKADNFTFDSLAANANLKIIDFGNSHTVEDGEKNNMIIGGKHYLPPESFRNQMGWELKKGDMWMIGICCYVLLCGAYPFTGENDDELYENIRNLRFSWPTNIHLSNTCKDFIENLLCLDIEQRFSASRALKHPWITGSANDDHLGNDHMHKLKLFAHGNRLQHILVNTMLSAMSTEDKHELHKILTELNLVENGTLDFADVIHYMLVNSELKENTFRMKELHFLGPIAKHRSSMLQFKEDFDIDVILDDIAEEVDGGLTPCVETEDFAFSVCFPHSPVYGKMKSLHVKKYEKQLEKEKISVNTVISILKRSTESQEDIEIILRQLKPTVSNNLYISEINSFS